MTPYQNAIYLLTVHLSVAVSIKLFFRSCHGILATKYLNCLISVVSKN